MPDIICPKCGRHFPNVEWVNGHLCMPQQKDTPLEQRNSVNMRLDFLKLAGIPCKEFLNIGNRLGRAFVPVCQWVIEGVIQFFASMMHLQNNVGDNRIGSFSRPLIENHYGVPSPEISHVSIKPLFPSFPAMIDGNSFRSIDAHALAVPHSAETSITALAAYLVRPAQNDFEKTRAIFRWITNNISYDYAALVSGINTSISPHDVLRSRSSVCQGYSQLFSSLAESAGLENVLISGWAKGIQYKVGDSIMGPTDHAWNAVKIDHEWRLIDSTWGTGHIAEGQFVRQYDENYFFTPPELLILNHYPEHPKWQLLRNPISKNQFISLPYVYSKYFDYQIDFSEHNTCVIRVKGRLDMTFTVPTDVYLLVNLREGQEKLNQNLTMVKKSGQKVRITLVFPRPGEYVLTICARKGSDYGYFDGILEYKVLAS